MQNIKGDLNLSDIQLGLLTGIAFAMFYSVMGIPIARWADRGNRVTIVTLTTALWSAAVALCGLVGSFLHLLLVRVGVAVGEAGCMPTAHSLIADYFSRAERPRAVGIYMLGGPLSMVIGYFVAGWLNELYGWRTTFILLGLPGLGLAVLAWFTLREPRRGKPVLKAGSGAPFARRVAPANDTSSSGQPSVKEACLTLWANATFRHLLFCYSVVSFFAYGILQWQPTFFIRSYGLQTGELGTWFAVINGLGGMLGIYWGGALASRYAANNERLQLKAVAVVYATYSVILACMYLSVNQYWTFGWMALATVGGSMAIGPQFATIQTVVPERMRAMSIVLVFLAANLVGMGLGPLAAGALSDALRPLLGEESLRYALLALSPGYIWGGWYVWRASTTVARDLEAVQICRSRTAQEADFVVPISTEASGA